ncbi:uncharacterized protein [Prorops nasuta]|uniref:uncharacterized protein n=1 Tax=Prorops nasuta TaxID=863751 RepID=UPI0034CF7F53
MIHPIFLQVLLPFLLCIVQIQAQNMKFSRFDVVCEENEWFAKFDEATVNALGHIDTNIPVLQEITEDSKLSVKMKADYCGAPIPEFSQPLCKALANNIYGTKMAEHGEPKGSFPTKCNINPYDYHLSNFTLSYMNMPPCPMKNADMKATISINGPAEQKLCVIEVQGSMDLIMPMPGIGK